MFIFVGIISKLLIKVGFYKVIFIKSLWNEFCLTFKKGFIMVKSVSVEKVINHNDKHDKKEHKKTSDKDFLQILLSNLSTDKKASKKEISKEKELLKEIKEDKKDAKTLSLEELLELTKNHKNLDLTEIKKILSSKIKQQNILLSESDKKEFKNIKSLKDLMKFANKKGLNIENIKVEVSKKNNKIEVKPKNEQIKESITSSLMKDKLVKTESAPKIKQNSKKVDLNSILSNHESQKTLPKKEQTIKTSEVSKKNISLDDLINPKTTKHKKEIKKDETEGSNNINLAMSNNDFKLKNIFAKETLKQVSSNLKDAIKEYKPPISKFSMELNPDNLGKVEVTLIKRGNDIQVTLNSNNQTTMHLFAQHQAEFRASLANIGFSNVDMSFNSNKEQQNEKNKEKYKQNQASSNQEEEISEIEIKGVLKYA